VLISRPYINLAETVFLRPVVLYAWDEVVEGVIVRNAKKMAAVGSNTFRGFHRCEKKQLGAKSVFVSYFMATKKLLVAKLSVIRSRPELNVLCNEICADLRIRLTNIKPWQLVSYNKLRKPVDLYIEHLVSLSGEMAGVRTRLVPSLALPLDSQMFAHPELFTDDELRRHSLSRRSTFQGVRSEDCYQSLQQLVDAKAKAICKVQGKAFHPIYYDLLWNGRYTKTQARNLFESNL